MWDELMRALRKERKGLELDEFEKVLIRWYREGQRKMERELQRQVYGE